MEICGPCHPVPGWYWPFCIYRNESRRLAEIKYANRCMGFTFAFHYSCNYKNHPGHR